MTEQDIKYEILIKELTIEASDIIERLSRARTLLAQSWIYLPREGNIATKVAAFLDEGLFGQHK